MGLFDVFSIAGSGTNLNRVWLDCVSDNIANINTVRSTSESAFQARYVVAQSADGFAAGDPKGVNVTGIALGNAEGRVVYEPDNPLADTDGYVRRPDIDLGDQMTQLIQAQRGYQANLAVVERATQAYQTALQIGRNA
ncbi:MAG: flagellar basal body rod protein FlgC [Actinobacteria bacterium]|jgi:flagellar basal-body rod protein FlgC|nr:flagellar basal body rod protein FlgC [Actinomycetota bacterium]